MDEQRATISVEAAARILGISRGLAYQMVREHKLPVIRFGRRLLVPRKRLDDILSGTCAAPAGSQAE